MKTIFLFFDNKVIFHFVNVLITVTPPKNQSCQQKTPQIRAVSHLCGSHFCLVSFLKIYNQPYSKNYFILFSKVHK